jgi:hypothetical protein
MTVIKLDDMAWQESREWTEASYVYIVIVDAVERYHGMLTQFSSYFIKWNKNMLFKASQINFDDEIIEQRLYLQLLEL